MKHKKRLAIAACVLICAALLFQKPIANYITRHPEKKAPDFSIRAIETIFPSEPRWASSKEEGIEAILRQRFTYLDAGVQSYVFLSEDKRYVLKFFKQGRHSKRPDKREGAFTSYKIAYDLLREETGLVFLHLVPQDGFSAQTTLVDHLKHEHTVELGNFEFLLQKRADLIEPTLAKKMEEKKEEEAKQVIDALFAFFHDRLDKGVLDDDPKIPINLGILEGKAVQIDIGRFSIPASPRMFKADYAQFLKKNAEFGAWLKKDYPSLYAHYRKQLKLLEEHYKRLDSVL